MKKQGLLLFLIALSVRLSASILIMNGLTHIHTTTKGSQVNGKIVVKNESKKEARVLVYKQDLISTCGKSIEYTEINKHRRSLGNWLKTNIDEKLLAPGEEYTIQYTINMPQEDLEKGTYWSVLMVEGANPVKEENKAGMQINSKVRYAVQVLADMGSFESPKLGFEDVQYDGKTNADKIVKVKLKNEGVFSAKTKISLEVYSEKGDKIKTIEGLSKRIYPNLCNEFEIILADLPKGKYEGVLIADNGKDMFGSNITLDVH